MKTCPICQKQLEDNENCACLQVKSKQRNRKKLWILIAAAVLTSVALIVATVVAFSSSRQIDPFDYFEITFSGYDTYGELEYEFHRSELIEQIIGEEPDSPDLSKYFMWVALHDEYSENIKVACSQAEGLSNGDEVTVTISATGKARDKIQEQTRTFIVDDLQELQTVNVFLDLGVTFDGISGEAELTLSKNPENTMHTLCRFDISQEYDLAAGDIVTISIANYDNLAVEHGILVTPVSKEYTVPPLPEYLTDPDRINKESLQKVIEAFLAEEKSENDADWLFTYTEPVYYMTYLCVAKPDTFIADNNVLKIYVSYDRYLNGEYRETIYTSLDYRDVVIPAGETISFTYVDGVNSTFSTDMAWKLCDLKEDYYVYEVKLD